jgi:hypothetical protein
LPLRRIGRASSYLITVGVEHDDVPAALVVRIVALARRARCRAELPEVAGRA